jgi:hypothetical protein
VRRGLWVLGLVAILGAVPVMALAQSGNDVSGLLLRVQGDLRMDADESADLVMVVNGDADIWGRVGTVVVVGGRARLEDARVGRLLVVQGTAELVGSARVYGDVWLLSAQVQQSPASHIGGSVQSVFGAPAWRLAMEEPLLGAGLLVLVLGAGWAAVAVGAGRMRRAAGALTAELPGALGAALFLFVLAPVLALLLFFTVVGLPVSVVFLAVCLPLLALAGFCVAALRVGSWMLRSASPRPYGAMLLGGVALAAAGLIPYAGQVIVLAACALGAGALTIAAGSLEEEEAGEIPAGRGG